MSARIEVFPQIAAAEHYVDDTNGEPRRVEAGEPTGAWYWRLAGGNGETMCVSEAYTRKASAKRAASRSMTLMHALDNQQTMSALFPRKYESSIVEVSR